MSDLSLLTVKPEAFDKIDGVARAIKEYGFGIHHYVIVPYENYVRFVYGEDNSSMHPEKLLINPDPSFGVSGYPLSLDYFLDSYRSLKNFGRSTLEVVSFLVSHTEENTALRLIRVVKGRDSEDKQVLPVERTLRAMFGLRPPVTQTDIFGNGISQRVYDIRHNGLHCPQIHEGSANLDAQLNYELKTVFEGII